MRAAEEEVVGNELGVSRDCSALYHFSKPRVERLAAQLGSLRRVEHLDGHRDLAARREEEQVGEQHPDAPNRTREQLRLRGRVSPAEHAAPQAARATSTTLRIGHGVEDVGRRAGTAEAFDAIALNVAGGPEDDRFAVLNGFDSGGDGGLGLLARLGAGLFQVRHLDGVEQFR